MTWQNLVIRALSAHAKGFDEAQAIRVFLADLRDAYGENVDPAVFCAQHPSYVENWAKVYF